ncbi:MAG TPA: hypothetical protein VK604_16880 [Bryobacteraceae bacterium]|nr:hypothetical protein [Bryobacteraceae bacterium]
MLPPSPEIPNSVADLTAVQRGGQLMIAFRTPPRTTDSLPIKNFAAIDLRIGPAVPPPFDFDRWAAGAKPYPVPSPDLGDPQDPQAVSISQTVPAADWAGQRVVIAVRTTAKKGETHYSSWSNRVTLNVIAALTPPAVTAQATAKGVLLSWPATPGAKYRVLRQGPAEPAPVEEGIAEESTYLDASAQFDTPYKYFVVVLVDTAESLPSEATSVTPLDKFPPSVPTAPTALASPSSIEVSWQRNSESDLAGYYVYRSVNGSPFERQGQIVTLPLYSDHAVEAGKLYRYQVTAVDKKNNESEKSAIAEAAF